MSATCHDRSRPVSSLVASPLVSWCVGLGMLVAQPAWAAPPLPAPPSVEPGAALVPTPPSGAEAPAPGEGTEAGVESPDGEAAGDSSASEGEPESPERQRAIELFSEGTRAYELGEYAHAIELFEEAWRLLPEPAMLFNLGQAHWRWFDVDPEIDHLRKARTFFQNYDKRMQGTDDYFPSEVNAFITALNTQITAEEQKKAERERPVITGPSVAELEAAERRRLNRDKNLLLAKRLNASGVAFLVAGGVSAAVGVAGLITRAANGIILDNTSGNDPDVPNVATTEEDERRRNAYLVGGQVAFGGFIAAAVFMPIGIGLRVGGAVIEKRELGQQPRATPATEVPVAPAASQAPAVSVFVRPGSLLAIEF